MPALSVDLDQVAAGAEERAVQIEAEGRLATGDALHARVQSTAILGDDSRCARWPSSLVVVLEVNYGGRVPIQIGRAEGESPLILEREDLRLHLACAIRARNAGDGDRAEGA